MSAVNLNVYETQVKHASDLVHWVEGSGPELEASRPVAGSLSKNLDIKLIEAPLKFDAQTVPLADRTPSDLTVTHKSGVMILWRFRASGDLKLRRVLDKSDSVDGLVRPLEDAYKVSGVISDRLRQFNPREFNLLDVGNFIDVADPTAKGHEVKLYRSPQGTQMGSLGGLQARLQWDTGEPASWAIITCQVTLRHTTGTRSYHAQADINGDFRLAFAALPFPKKEGDSRPPYVCSITVTALKTASGTDWHQPDDFISGELKSLDADEFNPGIGLNFQAGITQRLISSGSDAFLIIRNTP